MLSPGARDAELNAEFRLCYLGSPLASDHGLDSISSLGPTEDRALDQPIPTPFEALSYTWEEPVFPKTIKCDNTPVPITQNLFEALVHIRNAGKPRVLWIDALCINQSDDEEKSSQIPLMRLIFSTASRVLIWLGLEDEHSSCALQFIETIVAEAKSMIGKENVTMNDLNTSEAHRRLWTQLELPLLDWQDFRKLCMDPVRHLFERPWFSRVWTLQEAMLSKTATVIIGNRSLDWMHLGIAVVSLLWKNEEKFHVLVYSKMVTAAQNSFYARTCQGSTHLRRSLDVLLSNTWDCKCTEPRDKIYGLLGLAANDLGIKPDYKSPVEDVYMDAIRRLIFSDDSPPYSVSILSHAQHHRDDKSESFPSWVPLWHRHHTAPAAIPPHCHFTAGGEKKQQKTVAVCSKVIVLEGFIAGTIKCVTKMPEGTNDRFSTVSDNNKYLDGLLQLLQFVGSLSTPYVNGDSILEVFARILTRGQPFGQYDFRNHFSCLVKMHLQALGDKAVEEIRRWDRVEGLLQKIEDVLEEEYDRECDRRMTREIFLVLNRRELFGMGNGLLGVGPNSLREGDKVCVFYDARQPFALRELEDGSFRLLGECYVHGIMHGEALRDGEQTSRTFAIR